MPKTGEYFMNQANRYKICCECPYSEFPIIGSDILICKKPSTADCLIKIHDKEDHTLELKDTLTKMLSKDYKERFETEYYQLVIRFRKLQVMLQKWDDGELEFEPSCPRGLLNLQIRAMADYIAVLEARAMIENIPLEKM